LSDERADDDAIDAIFKSHLRDTLDDFSQEALSAVSLLFLK